MELNLTRYSVLFAMSAFPISLTSSSTLQWMLIGADGMLASNKTQEAQMKFLHCKNRAYHSLNNALSRDTGNVSDALLGGIIMATITESHLSNLAACNAYLYGYEAAIRARGGLRNSLLVCSTCYEWDDR
jgi:hypothetical protein